MRSPSAVFAILILSIGSPTSAQSCLDRLEESGAIKFATRGWETDFCIHSVPLEEFKSGGPPRDGIPPIDEPRFAPLEEARSWIDDAEPVIAVDLDGDVRAYPLQILTWHEIVNDHIGGTPVAVTFCPLCYAAIVFRRPIVDGLQLTFGTTGNLRNSDLVMWDRQTQSWWQQFTGEAVVGELTGTVLETVPSQLISWKEFHERYPGGRVLSKDTGFDRRYGENPYVGYDDSSKPPWLYDGDVGDQLRPMERVAGIEVDGNGVAFRLAEVAKRRVVNSEIGGQPFVLFWSEGTASSLDRQRISEGKRIGSILAFRATQNGKTLHFEFRKDAFVDEETGSKWNLFGESTAGPLRGRKLDPIQVHNTFWFVWSAFLGPESLQNVSE